MNTTTTAVHPYFTRQARAAMHRAGGDPDRSRPLAQWAQDVFGDDRSGVVVAEDGTLIARTRRTEGGTYIAPHHDSGLWTILDMGMGDLAQRAGQPVTHVRYSDVCQGAAEFVPEV